MMNTKVFHGFVRILPASLRREGKQSRRFQGDLKITNSVLPALREILLALSQVTRDLRSASILP